jgi:helix-turn-helix protein
MKTQGGGSVAVEIESERNLHEVLNTRDVAKIMRCGVRKVRCEAAAGKLPMKKFGGEFIITRKRLNEFLDSPEE